MTDLGDFVLGRFWSEELSGVFGVWGVDIAGRSCCRLSKDKMVDWVDNCVQKDLLIAFSTFCNEL